MLLRLVSIFVLSAVLAFGQSIVSIDCGSAKDKFFSGGATYTFSAPDIDTTIRHGSNFSYNIPVGNGLFRVKMTFIEVFPTYREGSRKFHVDLNGVRVLENFDIAAETNTWAIATMKSFEVESKNLDGIQLRFVGSTRSAIVSSIEVEEVSPTGMLKAVSDDLNAKLSQVVVNSTILYPSNLRVFNEVVSGSGLVYTLKALPADGSLRVWRSGVRQDPGNYYRNGQTITFLFAAGGDYGDGTGTVLADYEVYPKWVAGAKEMGMEIRKLLDSIWESDLDARYEEMKKTSQTNTTFAELYEVQQLLNSLRQEIWWYTVRHDIW